jgi:hypothetical protein
MSYHDAPEELDGPLPHGRPYALSATGEKFYADCIIACDGDAGLARKHVLQSQGAQEKAEIDTRWNEMVGSVLSDSLEGPAAKLVRGGDRADVWVGEDSYVSTLVVGGGEELVFTTYDLDADNEGELDIDDLVDGWDAAVAGALTIAAKEEAVGVRRLKIRQKPGSLVSRKSRKLLLFGKNGFSFPPHSPHLAESYHVEGAATLAVCLRKAASVPLGLEVYTRMRNPRYAQAMMMAQERFNTITASAAQGELEAAGLAWEIEVGNEPAGLEEEKVDTYWDYDAEKYAEKNFDGIIDTLTQELLGRQREMAAAQAKAAEEEAEEEAVRRKMEELKLAEEEKEHDKAGNEEVESQRDRDGDPVHAGGPGAVGLCNDGQADGQIEAEEEDRYANGDGDGYEDEDEDEDYEDQNGGVRIEAAVCTEPREEEMEDPRDEERNFGADTNCS